MSKSNSLIPVERIENRILLIRGEKVILDADLAEMYGVETRALNQAVRRNQDRFPSDFMFQLSPEEYEILRSQSVTSRSWGGRRYPPYVFSEQGVAMLSGILNSQQAVRVNIAIMRAFVHMRKMLTDNKELASKVQQLETKLTDHDQSIRLLVTAIKNLASPKSVPKKRRIGFNAEHEQG